MKRYKKTFFSGVLLCMSLLVFLLLAACSASSSFEEYVKSGNYADAISLYRDKISGNSAKELEAKNFLLEYTQETLLDYASGEIDNQSAESVFDCLLKINDELYILNVDLGISLEQFTTLQMSKENYAKGAGLQESGKLEDAMEAFLGVVSEDAENYDRAQDKLAEIGNAYTREYADAIDSAFCSNDYAGVIREYAVAHSNRYVTISSDMTDKYTSSMTSYLDDVSKKAEDAFGSSKDYSAAIRILQNSIAEVNVDEDLVAKLDQKIVDYQEYIPVALTSLQYTQKARYISVGDAFNTTATDVNGKQYDASTVICPTGGSLASEVASTDEEAYVLYNLNLKYSSFSGTIYRPYESLSSVNDWNVATSVKIYGDEVLLYEAPNITKSTYDSYNFNIDISGVRNLKIVMRGVWAESTGWVGLYDRNPKVCMAEVMLQK